MLRLSFIAAALALGAAPALAGNISVQTFGPGTVQTGAQAPGVWYVDRHAPAGFQSQVFDGDDRLALTLSEDDDSAGRGAQSDIYYATQGRKYDIAGSNFLEIEFYLDPDLEAEPGRIAGIWGTAVDASDTTSAYPIIEFESGTFQGYQVITGEWTELGLGSATFGNWVTLGMMIAGSQIDYLINDVVVFSQDGNGSVGFSNVMLQAYNYDPGVDRTVYFDNLVAAEVPVPAALPLLAGGLAALGFVARCRRG